MCLYRSRSEHLPLSLFWKPKWRRRSVERIILSEESPSMSLTPPQKQIRVDNNLRISMPIEVISFPYLCHPSAATCSIYVNFYKMCR